MKKILLILAILTSFGAYAAQTNSQNIGAFNKALVQKNCADLILVAQTYNCPAGFSGTYTIWIVADQQSGAVLGWGTYNQCVPVEMFA